MSEQRYYFGIPFEVRASKADEPKFKVGDRVRAEGGYSFDPSVGEVAKIDDGYYKVRLDTAHRGQDVWNYVDADLTLDAPFAAGDRVKLKRNTSAHAVGDEGTVYRADSEFTGVKMDAYGQRMSIATDWLELAADCAERKEQQGGEAKPKFKAGDVVRVLVDDWADMFKAGDTFTLTGIAGDYVEFIDVDGDERSRLQAEVELVQPEPWLLGEWDRPQPCIVARVLDGQPRPSNIPYMHADSGAALLEAERLAKNNPGQEFAVYQRVGARIAEVQYNMKEVA